MRPLWKGSVSFGLVNIPVGLYSAIGQAPTIDLDLLRKSDRSRIRYKKVAEADGKEVTNEPIVKGYEYEKDQYVIDLVELLQQSLGKVQSKKQGEPAANAPAQNAQQGQRTQDREVGPAQGGLTSSSLPSLEQVRQQQCHLHRLLVIQARIERRAIIPSQVRIGDARGAAGALGHIFPGQFEMHSTEMRAVFCEKVIGQLELFQNRLKPACLDA